MLGALFNVLIKLLIEILTYLFFRTENIKEYIYETNLHSASIFQQFYTNLTDKGFRLLNKIFYVI